MSEYIVRIPSDMPYEIKAELNAWYVESEPIVRCRDCRFYKRGDDGYWCLRSISTKSNHPNGFCSWGDRNLGR